MLVSGPTATTHAPSRRRQVSTMNSTASRPSSGPRRRGQVGAVEAALAVDHRGRSRLGQQRSLGAGVDGDVDPQELAHDQRVVGRAVERRVAGHGGDAEQLAVPGRDDDGDRVVVTRVAVEDHRHHDPTLSPFRHRARRSEAKTRFGTAGAPAPSPAAFKKGFATRRETRRVSRVQTGGDEQCPEGVAHEKRQCRCTGPGADPVAGQAPQPPQGGVFHGAGLVPRRRAVERSSALHPPAAGIGRSARQRPDLGRAAFPLGRR